MLWAVRLTMPCICLVLTWRKSLTLASRLRAVPALFFVTMYRHRRSIQKLGNELQQHNQRLGTGLNIKQLAKSRSARASFANLSMEMKWLLPKFEVVLPGRSFAYHAVNTH
jgi:hypothetical protein